MTRLAPLLAVLIAILAARPAGAQEPATLDRAIVLYASAAYDDALALLERLPARDLDAQAQVSIDHYRMLCLLALGRSDEAEAVIVALLDAHPTYRIAEGDASPRVMRVFAEARRRALPGVVRRRYDHAKREYDERRFAAAATEFAVVRALVSGLEPEAGGTTLADLTQLAAGFEELSRAAIAAEERRVADAQAAAEARAREAEQAAAERAATAPTVSSPTPVPVPPPAPPDGVYGVGDRGVVPPVVVRQDIRRWTGPLPPPPAGTPLGEIAVVIDETGAVARAAVVASVSGFYDAILLDSAKTWRYQPATKDGRPVKFRRVLAVLSR